MSYTTTEEREFIVELDHPLLQASVQAATQRLAEAAKKKGFEYEIPGTFQLLVSRTGAIGSFHVRGIANYAKIVMAAQDALTPENPFDDSPEADDEYAEHDRRKAAELGMSVESYKRGVEDR